MFGSLEEKESLSGGVYLLCKLRVVLGLLFVKAYVFKDKDLQNGVV